eukprot:g8201.t1
MAAPLLQRGENGLIKQEQKMPASFFPIVIGISMTMGQVLAWPIYLLGDREAYDKKIDILASLNLGWLYLALFVVYYTKQIVSQHASFEGPVGTANRAQRGFENLMEYLPMYLAYLCAVGFVYPFPVFMNACVFFLARAKYAFDYTASTDARTAGFAVFGMAQALVTSCGYTGAL